MGTRSKKAGKVRLVVGQRRDGTGPGEVGCPGKGREGVKCESGRDQNYLLSKNEKCTRP